MTCLARNLHWLGFSLFLAVSTFLVHSCTSEPVYAHEHAAGETAEQARVVEFYRTWKRPQGVFGVQHRLNSCCYSEGEYQDCFPVLALRTNEKGIRQVKPDVSGAPTRAQLEFGGQWYDLNTKVDENLQPDPRESPDGRGHVCIAPAARAVVCYVPGMGT